MKKAKYIDIPTVIPSLSLINEIQVITFSKKEEPEYEYVNLPILVGSNGVSILFEDNIYSISLGAYEELLLISNIYDVRKYLLRYKKKY